jgi:hypothetical protein
MFFYGSSVLTISQRGSMPFRSFARQQVNTAGAQPQRTVVVHFPARNINLLRSRCFRFTLLSPSLLCFVSLLGVQCHPALTARCWRSFASFPTECLPVKPTASTVQITHRGNTQSAFWVSFVYVSWFSLHFFYPASNPVVGAFALFSCTGSLQPVALASVQGLFQFFLMYCWYLHVFFADPDQHSHPVAIGFYDR